MTPVLSTHLFVGHRLTTVWLERAWDAGFPSVEIFCARPHIDYRDKAQIGELGHWFRDSKLQLHSVHSPIYNDDVGGRSGPQSIVDITETTKAKRIAIVDEVKRALEIADVIPFRYLVQHFGTVGQEFDERRIDSAFSSLEEIKVFAAQRGVQVLLENIPNEHSTAERLNYFLGQTHLDLGYCFDIGHAHLGAGIDHEFELMKDRIRSTHLHDNNGEEDSHLFPFNGTIDWRRAMELLRSRPDQYPLLLELKEPPKLEQPIEQAMRAFDKLQEIKSNEQ
jgi:sugar phosphate isomerase/epimerase